ncbi:MAG: hypothetical protein ABIQ39_12945, partial [Ilumatobacteraceae bacterium]
MSRSSYPPANRLSARPLHAVPRPTGGAITRRDVLLAAAGLAGAAILAACGSSSQGAHPTTSLGAVAGAGPIGGPSAAGSTAAGSAAAGSANIPPPSA